MPVLQITTNLPKISISTDFVKKISELAAELTHRPEKAIEVIILSDQIISFSGTQDPAAFVYLGGIDCLEERNSIAKRLHDFLVAELGLKSERFYVMFQSIQPNDVSFSGKMYSDILAGK